MGEKKIIRHILLLLLPLLFFSCSRKKLIPEEQLGNMIAEMVLVDSYVTNVIKPSYRQRDTIDYFNPILDKYGYTIGDLEYTIERYSARKTDVIWNTLDVATNRVVAINELYDRQNRMRQDFLALVTERSRDTLFYDTDTVRIRKEADIGSLIMDFPINRRGTFELSFDYKMHPDNEKNDNAYTIYYLQDTIDPSVKSSRHNYWLTRTRPNDDKRTSRRVITVTDPYFYNNIEIYTIDYWNRARKDKPKFEAMDTKIWNILVTFTPYPEEVMNDVILEDYPMPVIFDVKSIYEDRYGRRIITPLTLEAQGIVIEAKEATSDTESLLKNIE